MRQESVTFETFSFRGPRPGLTCHTGATELHGGTFAAFAAPLPSGRPMAASHSPTLQMIFSFRIHPMFRCCGRRFLCCAATCLTLAMGWSGCATADLVYRTQDSFDRAVAADSAAAFFAPVLAEVRGQPPPPAIPPKARPHYLEVILAIQPLGTASRETLDRAGLLGTAYTLQTLALWRLGRLDEARTVAAMARETGQDSLHLRERTLFDAFEGVDMIQRALAESQSGAPFADILDLIGGDDGAWKALGAARAEAARGPIELPELLEARLAAFKILKDAHDRIAADTKLPDTQLASWQRLRADAQIELEQLAGLPAREPVARAATVREWQVLCGLDPTVR
jgi:hypothetical protein